MVFKYKLPEPSRPQRISAYDIAREHGVNIATVMEAIETAGEFVDSARKKSLETPVVRHVCEILGVAHVEAEHSKPVPAWELRAAEARPTQPITQAKLPVPTPSRTRFDPPDRSERLGFEPHDASPSFAAQEWKLYGISEVERDLWIAEGLREGQAKMARDLRTVGFSPTDLRTDVLGWTVAKRLRAGERPREVFRLLQEVRRGKQESA